MPWIPTLDPKSGRSYWYDTETHETSWDMPDGLNESDIEEEFDEDMIEEAQALQGDANAAMSIKSLVSKQKHRFVKDGFDLDLTYITPQLIAMGFPSEGMEAMYRNPMSEVQQFFKHYHDQHYKVYNLCSERSYVPEKFNNSTAHYPFDDHNPCRFILMPSMCKDVQTFLKEDPNNVCAIHCKAGKGRSGMIIAAYMLWEKQYATAQEALDFFGKMRTKNCHGVTIPSQRRWVHYMQIYLTEYLWEAKDFPLQDGLPIVVQSIMLSGTPQHAVTPNLKIFRSDGEVIYNHRKALAKEKQKLVQWKAQEILVFEIEEALVSGDLQVVVSEGDKTLLCFWLHTGFMGGSQQLVLPKAELDRACKDKKHKMWPEDFSCTLNYRDQTDEEQTNAQSEILRSEAAEAAASLESKSTKQKFAGVRGMVSKKKKRFQEAGYDLDLSYITDRVIAMGFPSEGSEAMFRNPMTMVQKFFDSYHDLHYKIYNLCSERSYPPERFNNSTAHYPFDDHSPCRFDLLPRMCEDVDEFLGNSPLNVVAIHCKAGKGRSGLVICAYLLFAGIMSSPQEAITHFGDMRTADGKGVTIPSQIRYIHYFHHYLKYEKENPEKPFPITGLPALCYYMKLSPPPTFEQRGSYPYYKIARADGTVLYDYKKDKDTKITFWGKKEPFRELLCGIELQGDVHVTFHSSSGLNDIPMFGFWIHTSFLTSDKMCKVVPKFQLDKAVKDKGKHFQPDFKVELFYEILEAKAKKRVMKDEMSPHVAIMEGALKKQKANKDLMDEGGRWAKRYWALYIDMLMWSSKKGGKAKGTLPLQYIVFVKKIEPPRNMDGRRFDFVVQAEAQTYCFKMQAKTEESCSMWVKELTEASRKALLHFNSRSGLYNIKEYDTRDKFWKETLNIISIRSGEKSFKKRAKVKSTVPRVGNLSEEDEDEDGGGSDEEEDDMEEEEVYQGFLLKKKPRKVSSVWQNRYFVLYKDQLIYYKKVGGKPKGIMHMRHISDVFIHDAKKKGRRFDVLAVNTNAVQGIDDMTPDRVYALLAQTPELAQEWTEIIRNQINKTKARIKQQEESVPDLAKKLFPTTIEEIKKRLAERERRNKIERELRLSQMNAAREDAEQAQKARALGVYMGQGSDAHTLKVQRDQLAGRPYG